MLLHTLQHPLDVGLRARPSLTADFICPTSASQLANTAPLLLPAGWLFPTSCCPYGWQWAPLLSNQLSHPGGWQSGPSPDHGNDAGGSELGTLVACTCLMVCHARGQAWLPHASATGQELRIHPTEQCSRVPSNL